MDLQKMYYDDAAEDHVRHIYVTFESSDFTKSGISSGNYLLTEPHRSFEGHAKLIVSHSLDILKNMLVSYQHLRLDEKFFVRITVLSTSHLRHRLEHSRMRDPHILVGSDDADSKFIRPVSSRFVTDAIFSTPRIPYYENICLPIAMIIGFHYQADQHVQLWKKEKFAIEKRFKLAAKFYKKIKRLKKNPKNPEAINMLGSKWTNVCHDVGMSPNGPFSLKDSVDVIGEYFGMNVHVISSSDFKMFYRYPKELMPENPTIFLLLWQDNKHVDLILDRFRAFSGIGAPCLFCGRTIRREDRHRCYSKKMCFVCNRFKYDSEDPNVPIPFITKKTKKNFCIKPAGFNIDKCQNCGMSYRSDDCFKKHKNVGQCGLKRKCARCKRIYIKQYEHICDEKFCIRCKTNYDNSKAHFCKMLPQPKATQGCALAVYDCETVQDARYNSCYSCFYNEKDYLKKTRKTRAQLSDLEKEKLLCEAHKNSDFSAKSYHAINFISVFYETSMGTFALIEFADDALNYENDMKPVDGFKKIPQEDYYLPELYGQAVCRSKQRMRRKRGSTSSSNRFPIELSQNKCPGRNICIGQDHKETDVEYIKKNFSAIEKFLIFFIREKFRNTTFLGNYMRFLTIIKPITAKLFPPFFQSTQREQIRHGVVGIGNVRMWHFAHAGHKRA